LAKISLDQEAVSQLTMVQKSSFIGVCPSSVFDLDKSANIVVTSSEDCIGCLQCVRKWSKDTGVQVDLSPEKSRLLVESIGAITPILVVNEAIEIMKHID
jgi:hypothetical protein